MNRNEEIAELRKNGKTLKIIGEKYGITIGRVRQICNKMGVEVRRYYDIEDATLNAIKKGSTYPGNLVCVDSTGHLVFVSDGYTWVQIYNKKLRAAIRDIYNLQYWIEI